MEWLRKPGMIQAFAVAIALFIIIDSLDEGGFWLWAGLALLVVNAWSWVQERKKASLAKLEQEHAARQEAGATDLSDEASDPGREGPRE